MTILAEVGFKIPSITDIPTATAEHILTVAGLRDHFDDIVGSDTCRTRQLTRGRQRLNHLAHLGSERFRKKTGPLPR